MAFELTILGCGSATPTLFRNPSAQILKVNSKSYLIDCGEGTQIQLRKYKQNIQRINHIFISHLHGDHYLGLQGLISSMNLLGREHELCLYGPPGLKDLVMLNLKYSGSYLSYHINFHVTQFKEKEILFEDKGVIISSFPLKHRIDCTGFIFEEKAKERNIVKKHIVGYSLGIAEIVKLKRGEDVAREDGFILKCSKFTSPPPKPLKYAYCSDTRYYEKVIEHIEGADLLYHEATFLHELKDRAKKTFHSTAKQAALIAQKANVKKLLIGHYSSRYIDTKPLEDEAKSVFTNTVAVSDGKVFEL